MDYIFLKKIQGAQNKELLVLCALTLDFGKFLGLVRTVKE